MRKKAYFARGEIAECGEVAIDEATLIPPAKPTTTNTIVQPKDHLSDLNDILGTADAKIG